MHTRVLISTWEWKLFSIAGFEITAGSPPSPLYLTAVFSSALFTRSPEQWACMWLEQITTSRGGRWYTVGDGICCLEPYYLWRLLFCTYKMINSLLVEKIFFKCRLIFPEWRKQESSFSDFLFCLKRCFMVRLASWRGPKLAFTHSVSKR